jgi:transposase
MSSLIRLTAAVDLVSGVVHHAIARRHCSREFVSFLQQLDAAHPAGVLICILFDNHSAHRLHETRRFLKSKPGRFELVFTRTHASWLSRVEIFFSKIARSALRQIRVARKDELIDRIQRYIALCNEAPLVPKWSYGISREPQSLAVRFDSAIDEPCTRLCGSVGNVRDSSSKVGSARRVHGAA